MADRKRLRRGPWRPTHQLLLRLAIAVWLCAPGCDANEPTGGWGSSQPAARATVAVAASPAHPRCIVIAAASVDEGVVPLEVVLSAEGMCSHGAETFIWDFGDGSRPADGPKTAHVYVDSGTYTARVTITDTQSGVQDADDVAITVSAR